MLKKFTLKNFKNFKDEISIHSSSRAFPDWLSPLCPSVSAQRSLRLTCHCISLILDSSTRQIRRTYTHKGLSANAVRLFYSASFYTSAFHFISYYILW